MDIVDVLGDFIRMKRVGHNYRAKSPFSEERTPSFFVFPKNQNFKDFSSGKQGSAIDFLMEYDGLSYVDALLYLAKKYGIDVQEEEQTDLEKEQQSERESLFIILNFAKDFFSDLLWHHEEGQAIGLSYFKERGFSDDTIKKFELGYSLDSWDALKQAALTKGYSAVLLEKAGLIIAKEDRTYDRFRGRVIFPVHNASGKAIAFGARILTSDKKQPKYLNSPETAVYHKGHVLYGLAQARRPIRAQDNCYLVEGYTDVLSMHQAGVENVVSSSGTALTEDQVRLIKRITENITVLFDGDAAGMHASLRGIDMILSEGMNVRVVVFPDGEDPDSYARRLGTMGFQAFLKESTQDFIAFKTQLLHRSAGDDPIRRAEAINQIIASISLVTDPVKRALFMKQSSNLLGLEEQVLYSELNKILIARRQEGRRPEKSAPDEAPEIIHEPEPEKMAIDSVALQERESIRLLLNYGFNEIEEKYRLLDHYLEELGETEFHTPVYNEILQLFKNNLHNGHITSTEDLLRQGTMEMVGVAMELTSTRYEISENWEKYKIFVPREAELLHHSVYSNILRLKFRRIKKLLTLVKEDLKTETDQVKQTELLQIAMELKKAEVEFAKPLGIVIS